MSAPSLAELREKGQPQAVLDRLNDEHWLGRLYGRRLSPYATWVFARLGWSPNAVTASFIVCGIAAGVVIALDASGGQVSSFTLRTTDGQVMPFVVGTLETDGAAFPASHLAVHAATLQPIAVAYRVEGGRNVVYRMVDAPWARPS